MKRKPDPAHLRRRYSKSECTEPPDGGWGWAIVLAGFVATSFVVGLARAFGILYVEILSTFPESSTLSVSLISGLYNTLSTGLAPIAGALSNRFSCRKVVFLGGLLMSTGLILNIFATNVYFFMVTLGIMTGCGAGMCTTPGVVMVARYFKKRRAFANGVYLSGTSVGAFILPLLVSSLSNAYGFRGALLIIGGMTLNVSALALVYRPPELIPYKEEEPSKPNPVVERVRNFCQSLVDKLSCCRRKEDTEIIASNDITNRAVIVPMGKNGNDETLKVSEKNLLMEEKLHPVSLTEPKEMEKPPEPPKKKKRPPVPLTGLRRYLDYMLFKNRAFLLFVFSSGFVTVGYPHASVFMPLYAKKTLGIPKEETGFLLSIMATLDLFGRIGFGWISDKKLFKRIHGYQFAIAMTAMATLLLPLMTSYSQLAVNSAFYGLGVGSFFVLKPVLLADHHGAEKVSSSYGLMRLFHGMSSLITPPIAGALVDITGSFTAGFLMMGVVMMIGSVMLFAMPYCLKYEEEKEEREWEEAEKAAALAENGQSEQLLNSQQSKC